MLAEAHVRGSELGELQLAIWARQFRALRDGDRFFYRNDPGLTAIERDYGIDYRHTLAEIIAANTDVPLTDLNDNVFLVTEEEAAAPPTSDAPPTEPTTTTTGRRPGRPGG